MQNNFRSYCTLTTASVLALSGIAHYAQAQANVTITLNPNAPQSWEIPGDFAGLSLEMQTVRSDWNGNSNVHLGWLEGGVNPYNTMLETIGVHNVRIGGNTGEGGSYAYPTDLDATHVNDFAAQIGSVLIWLLPIESRYNVATYAGYAERMMSNKAGKNQTFRTVFEGGNEPDVNGVSYDEWQSRFDGYFNALIGPIGSNLFMTGPSAAFDLSYPNDFAEDTNYHNNNQSHIRYITQHWYPEGSASNYSGASAAIDEMLAAGHESRYQTFYNDWGQNAVNNGYLGKIAESNSMYGGGYPGASNAFAASLWSLDYLCWFAQNTEIEGINFHTANSSVAGYDPIVPVGMASSYTLQGVGYGIFAFSMFSSGQNNRAIPRGISNPSNANVTTYSNLQSDNTIRMVIINKSHQSSTASNVNVTATVNPGRSYGHAQIMYLSQANGDATQLSGIALGGQGVSGAGTWNGGFTQTITPSNGIFTISVPHTSAAIVHFY